MFNFFEVLSREVCDSFFHHFLHITYSMKYFGSTGKYYKQYSAKWRSYLYSAIEGYPPLPIIVSSRVANPVTVSSSQPMSLCVWQDMEHVKGRLDTLLREWKPCN